MEKGGKTRGTSGPDNEESLSHLSKRQKTTEVSTAPRHVESAVGTSRSPGQKGTCKLPHETLLNAKLGSPATDMTQTWPPKRVKVAEKVREMGTSLHIGPHATPALLKQTVGGQLDNPKALHSSYICNGTQLPCTDEATTGSEETATALVSIGAGVIK